MKATVSRLMILAVLIAAPHFQASAFELEEGVNIAGVIRFPTAFNQSTTHTLHTTIELTDIFEPLLNLYNLRYGLQLGGFQLISDLNYTLEPEHEFDYAEIKGKFQILALDEFRFYLAVGGLWRGVIDSRERDARIDGRVGSLFIVSTFELFPFDNWGGFLLNLYLDNRFINLGLKVQLYQSIQLVAEGERLHTTERTDKTHGRVGVSFEGVQNLYMQLLWSDEGENFLVQIGTGF